VTPRDSRFDDWLTSLEQRHLENFTFSEVAKALRALSSTYVERRHKLAEGAALATAGKRSAFALFYGPLHYLLVSHIVRQLPGALSNKATLIDLGCGTGAAGSAWAGACARPPRVIGVDCNGWALGEAAATYRWFGVSAETRRLNLEQGDGTAKLLPVPVSASVLAAFTLNELGDRAREALLPTLLERAKRGSQILIVEPIAGGVARWWDRWRREIEDAGGRSDEWRVRAELPAIVAKLDRAVRLDHRELTGRSLWMPGPLT